MLRMRTIKHLVAVLLISFLLIFLSQRYLSASTLFSPLPQPMSPNPDSTKTLSSHNRHHQKHKWWKEAVVYSIYPRSFQDSNSDGIGDIPGLITRLPYLHDLGIDIISLGPHYQSPQIDNGYDISSYEDIYPPFGTLEDVLRLIEETHKLGMKIIFDLVINHSSDQHPWFLASRSSKDDPKRDWYHWRPGSLLGNGERKAPNNWRSHFSVPAWTWDAKTKEYYLHVYAPEMPDLNWENDECRQAIYESAIKFWLEKGLDGFRIDTVNKYSKDLSFPDAEITRPGEGTQPAAKYYNNGPRIHEFLGEMKAIFVEYGAISVGELSHFTGNATEVLKFVSEKEGQLDMVFNLKLSSMGWKPSPDRIQKFVKEISLWQKFIRDTDGWGTLLLENHDSPRSISRFASDATEEDRIRSGKMLAMVLGTLSGTLFLYQGQEIGMVNAPREWGFDELKDVRSVNFYKDAKERYASDPAGLAPELDKFWRTARDHARLPMQWNSTPNAGFCSKKVEPWMRVHDAAGRNNVQKQEGNEGSLLAFWKQMLRLRKEYKELFIYGTYKLIKGGDRDVFVYVKFAEKREGEGKGKGKWRSLTVVNMSGEMKKWNWDGVPSGFGKDSKLVLSNVEVREEGWLKPWEGRVYLDNR